MCGGGEYGFVSGVIVVNISVADSVIVQFIFRWINAMRLHLAPLKRAIDRSQLPVSCNSVSCNLTQPLKVGC